MSLTFIHDFRNQLYTTISNNNEIMSKIKRIYFGAVQDGKSPFLIINILKAVDLSRHNESIYSVEFQILAYAKDRNHQMLVRLADKIIKLLSNQQIFFENYQIAGIKANDLEFEKAADLVLNKLTINYKALIKKEIYDELS